MTPEELAQMLGVTLPAGAGPLNAPALPYNFSNLPAAQEGPDYGNTGLDDPEARRRVISTIQAEAGGEGDLGQRAVAAVIRNRGLASGEPFDAIVRRRNQFEPWNTPQGRARMAAFGNSPGYADLESRMMDTLLGNAPDPTGGATHFFSPTAQAALGRPPPRWGLRGGMDIGRHRFFTPDEAGAPPSASGPGVPLSGTPEQGAVVRQQVPNQGQGGPWSTYANNDANKAFLINFGLALMTGGGWNGPMATLGHALAAGYRAREATETGQEQDIRQQEEDLRRQERHESELELREARGGYYERGGARGSLMNPEVLRQNRLMQAFLERFGQSSQDGAQGGGGMPGGGGGGINQEEWNRENQPGGLVHRIFGGPQRIENAPQLVQKVQDRLQTMGDQPLMGPRGYPTLSGRQLMQLQQSTDPADKLRLQQELNRIQKYAPPRGHMWALQSDGRIVAEPIQGVQQQGRGRGGGGGSQFSIAAQAGMDAAMLSIDRMREYVNTNPLGQHMIGRAAQQNWMVGDYGRLLRSMGDDVKSFVHARSGAQVAVREFDMYMQSLMPERGDTQNTVLEKLSRLQLGIMMIGRRHGAPVSDQDLLNLHNDIRQRVGLQPQSMEAFQRLVPALENQVGLRPGTDQRPFQAPPGTQVQPPIVPQGINPPAQTPVPNREEYLRRFNLTP